MNHAFARQLYFITQAIRGEPARTAYNELLRTERESRENLEALQFERLKKLLLFAYTNVPFYTSRFIACGFDPHGFSSVTDLKRIPVLTKKDIQDSKKALFPARDRRKYTKSSSSGSTAIPVSILRDNLSWSYHHAALYRFKKWYGLEIGDKYAMLWGIGPDIKSRVRTKARDLFYNRIKYSPYGLTHKRMDSFIKRIRGFRPRFLEAYPSSLYDFSLYLQEISYPARRLNFELIITSGETLQEHQKKLAENIFGCRVVEHYGCSETGIIYCECPDGGRHIPIESCFVEIDGMNTDREGKIIVTDLHNYVMPMIRYEVGDIGKMTDEKCACGRNHPTMAQVKGRISDTIETVGGHKTNALFFYHVFQDLSPRGFAVRQYQVIQNSPDRITLKIVKNEFFDEGCFKKLDQRIRAHFPKNVEFDYDFVDLIESDESGKYTIFLNESKNS